MDVAMQALDVRAELGERPVWDDRTRTVLWVDIDKRLVHRFDPTSSRDSVVVETDAPAGCVALREGGGFLVGAGRALHLFDADARRDGVVELVGAPEDVEFNDGAVDPAGRFVGGTSSVGSRSGGAALYSIDSSWQTRVLVDGITESNGVGWSPDGSTMYYVDSGETYFGESDQTRIRRFGYDVATGDVMYEDDLAVVAGREFVPDGLVVDAEGGIWVAVWGLGEVRRYLPTGAIERRVSVPALFTTCPGFGGDDLCDLFITTAQQGMDAAARAVWPKAGNLFTIRPGVKGLPPGRFRG